jgi:hypothetical protein
MTALTVAVVVALMIALTAVATTPMTALTATVVALTMAVVATPMIALLTVVAALIATPMAIKRIDMMEGHNAALLFIVSMHCPVVTKKFLGCWSKSLNRLLLDRNRLCILSCYLCLGYSQLLLRRSIGE